MSIFEIQGGPMNRRYLERKTKHDLCDMYMTLLDAYCKVQARADLAAEREVKQPDVGVIIRMNSEYGEVYRKTGNGGKAMRSAINAWIDALATHEQEGDSQ